MYLTLFNKKLKKERKYHKVTQTIHLSNPSKSVDTFSALRICYYWQNVSKIISSKKIPSTN